MTWIEWLVPILKGYRPAVTKSSDGKIWFVNGDAVSFIDPSHIGINTLPPPVHIERVCRWRRHTMRGACVCLPARPKSGDRLHGA